ncbi:hypothetical protein, partial [Rugosimonospora africana]
DLKSDIPPDGGGSSGPFRPSDRTGPAARAGMVAGHRLDICAHRGLLVIASAAAGSTSWAAEGSCRYRPARGQMYAITPGQRLLLAALVAHDLLVIHPASAVARLLADLHAEIIGGRHVG